MENLFCVLLGSPVQYVFRMMVSVWNQEKNGVRIDISKVLLFWVNNINDFCLAFHQKFIQNPMLLENMLHLEAQTLVIAESEPGNSYHNAHF